MDFQLTEDETKTLDLIKCLSKMSLQLNTKKSHMAFTIEWRKLQCMLLERLDTPKQIEFYIEKCCKIIEEYIDNC